MSDPRKAIEIARQAGKSSTSQPFTSDPEFTTTQMPDDMETYDFEIFKGFDVNEIRAERQPNNRAILNSILQIGSTVIGDAVAGVGYLGEIGDINDIVSGKETEWGNWLTRLGESIKQKGEEIAPVYASQAAMTTFAPWDGEWWASNIPSIGSTLALIAPAAGTVGLVSRFSKALGIAQKMSAETGQLLRGLGSAVVSRHIENMMESKEVFDNSYQLALSKGKPEEEARAIAGRAASDSYNTNYINLITDVPQYLGLLGIKLPKGKPAGLGKALAGGFASEAAEEATQFIIQQEAERGAKIELGEEDDSTFGQRFVKYLEEPGLQTAAFFGGLGGTVFAGVGKVMEKIVDRANLPVEQARQEAVKDVVNTAVEKGDFETPLATVNEMKADPAIASNEAAQQNLAKAEEAIKHGQQVYNNLEGDKFQKEKTELATQAKVLEQNLQQNQQNYAAIAANIENKDGLDYQFLKLQKEALKNDRSEEAKAVRNQIDKELNSDRFKEVEDTRTQYSPYTTQLKTLAAEKVRDMKQQQVVANEMEKYETPEGQEQLAKEAEKKAQQEQEKIINKAQEATTPEQVNNLKQANPGLADKLDEVKQNKAAEQSKEAPSNWKDYTPENIDEYMKARYEGRPFLLERDMGRAKVSTPEQLRDYYIDKLTPAEQATPQEPTSPEPTTQEDFGLQPAEEIPSPQPTEQTETTPVEPVAEEPLLDQLESEAAAKNAPEKVQESQEIEGYYERELETDDTVDGYSESDKIENPYLSITNDMALYQVIDHPEKGKLVEFSGIGKQGQVMPLEEAKAKYRINENATDWTTLYDTEGNTVPSQWRQPDIPEDELRTRFQQGDLGPGSLVKFVVDTTAGVSEVFDYNTWKSLRILMQVSNQQGEINVGMVKAFKDGVNYGEDAQNFQAFRKALYNEWVQAGKPAKFEFSKTGTLSEIFAGRYWNTPVRNNPKAILAADEPFVLGVGVTEGEGGAVQYVANNPGIDVQRSLKEPRPGGVYQAIRAANGKFAWSRIFTKRLSDETAKAKKGMFPTWEQFYGGFQDVSLNQVVMDLLAIAEQGKTDEAAAKFWKDNWPNIRRELQSIVRFNIVSDDGKTKRHAPDFRDNLPEIFRKNNFTAASYYNKYKLGDRPIQINAQLVNKDFQELGPYNDLVADRLETDINSGTHTHSPKFSVKFPDMGEVKADQPIVETDSLIGDPDEDFRFSIDTGEAYEVWNEAEETEWFKKRFPNVPIRVYQGLKTIGGLRAHGAFHKAAGVLVSSSAKPGTTYHEAFHVAFNLGLTEAQRAKVLAEARKTYGQKSDRELEEHLADAFQEYVQVSDTSLGSRIKRFFKRLLELIRFSLTNKMSIDYLFDRIEQGKYSGVQLGPRFETRYKLVEGFKNLAEQRQRLKEMMYLFDGVVSKVMQSKNIEDVKEAYSLIVSNMDEVLRGESTWEGIPTILSTLQAQRKLDMSQAQREKIDRFIETIKTKAIDKAFEQKLGSRGIYKREATANAEDTELFDIGEEDFVESWQTSQFKISPLENLSGKLKRFLDNVPRYKMVKNSQGRYPVILSDIGIPQTHDGKFLYADLQTRLGTSVSVMDMTNKLEALAKHMPHYDYILRAIAAKPALATDLFAMAQKAHPEFFDVVNHKGTYSIKYSNTDSLPNSLLSEWYTGFSSHYENKYLNAQGEVVYKKELEKKWQELSNKASSQDVTSELHEFFLKLGINIPLDVLQAAYADNNLGGITSKFNAILAPFVNSGKTEISKENKSTRAFAQEVSKYYPVTYQSAHINVEGNRQYEWINSSYMAKLVAKLKIPHLREGVEQMLRKDMFYNELLDSGVISLSRWSNARWGVVGGIKRSERGRGTGFTNYSDKDTAITLLSMFKEGWHPVSVNSGSSPVLATVKITDSYNKELSPDQALDKLFALANAEYARIQNRENPGWEAYTPGKYAFFPELNPESGTPGAPSKAKIAETMESQYEALRRKLFSMGVIDKNNRLTFDKSLDTDTFLRQFVYNFNLRQAEIVMMMQGDPSFYKNTEDFFKRAREVWSPGNYLDTKAQFITEDGRVIKFHRDKYNMKVLADVEGKAPQFDEIRDNLIESLKKTYGDTRAEGEIIGEVEVIMKEYEKVNLTDAQSYIDLYSYRLRLLGEGRWTQKLQNAYDILVPGGNSRTVFQPIKPFYYALQAYKTLVYPMQNKDAEFLLVPAFANGNPQLEEMLFDMGYSKQGDTWSFDEAGRDQGKYTDKISFESAIKVAVKEPFRGDTLEAATPIEMHWESWRRQMETPEHYIDAATRFGTQVMKLITADLSDNADFGNDRTGEDIKREYENLVIQDIIRSSDELMSRFAEVDDKGQLVSIDKEKFVQILREEVNQRQLGEQYLDALEMTYNEVLDEMDTTLPLFTPLHSTRVESMISSLFENNITKQKFANGVQLYNVSAYGLKRKPEIKFKNGSIEHVECYAPAYSKAFDKYRREDGTLHVEDVPKEMLEGLVYRIPTEDKYSMFNIKIIGFTNDSSGGAIILPSEITKIAGLDFDIDKTYGFFYGEPPAYNDLNVARQSVEGRKMLRANREKLDALYTSKKETLSKLDALFASKENSSNRRDALAHLYKEIDLELAFLRNDLRNAIKELQDEAYSLATTKMWLEEQGAPDLYNADVFLASQQESIGNQIESLNYYIEELENKKKRIEGLQIDLSSTITSKDQDVNQIFIENKKINDQIDVAKGEKALLIKNLNTPENQKLLQNKIDKIKSDNAKLKLMKEVLRHPSMTKAFLQPGGFHTIREITKTIRKWKGDTSQTASIINPNVIIDTIRRVNSGAALTGIAANYNASKARWQNYPMRLKNGFFLFEGQRYDDLSAVDVVNVEDKDATPRKVSKNIAEVLAAAVDNGKEPLAEYWNLNTYTADVAMSMLTTGVPLKTVMWFMSQPSIVKHAQEYFNLGGKEPVVALNAVESPHNITGKELREGLQKPNDEVQAKMLQNFLYYKNLVKPVTELVSATKVPDAGAGPSIAHTVSRQRQYYTRLEDRIEGSKAFLQSNSFHNAFVEKGIDQALAVFTKLGFPNFTIHSGLKKVLDMISGGVKTSDLTAEETNKIYQHYMEYLASAHPFFSATGARELHENLHHKVTAAKSKSDNLFLNRLEVTDKIINFRAVVSIHKEELNDYREAWAEMLKDQTEIESGYTMGNLATDLVRYSFLRSGFNPQGFGNFAHLQPIEFYTQTREGREFNNLIIKQVQAQNQVSDTKPYEGFVEQFIRNNFQRLYYVPEVKEEEVVFKDGNPVGLAEPKGQFDPKYKKFGNTLFKAIQGIYAPIPTLGIYEGETQIMREYQFGEQQPDSEFIEDTPKSIPPTKTPGSPSEYTNWSGGASDADAHWKKIGGQYGISGTHDFRPEDLDKLTSEQKDEVEWAYQQAWRQLGRRELDEHTPAGKLVRRDYLQAKKADAVFAISKGFEKVTDLTTDNQRTVVKGGTGYAVQMAINMNKPVYVFDQPSGQWFTWDGGRFTPTTIPQLTRNFAGVGTRELTKAGQEAIEQVYANTFVTRPQTQYEQTVPEDHGKVAEVNALEGKMPDATEPTAPTVKLNEEQQKAVDKIIEFINSESRKREWFTLEGKAGTGKTTVLAEVIKELPDNKTIAIAALAHKAKSNLYEKLQTAGKRVNAYTIAGLLNMKLNEETGDLERNPNDWSPAPVSEASYIIIDEASMINEEALELIMNMKASDTKVIFAGDPGQLPPIRNITSYRMIAERVDSPNLNTYNTLEEKFNATSSVKTRKELYTEAEELARKEGLQDVDSLTFTGNKKATLLERVRQGEESPILPYADYYWNNSQSDNPILSPVPAEERKTKLSPKGNLIFAKSVQEIYPDIIRAFKQGIENNNPNRIKVVAYRNATRQKLNSQIRNSLFKAPRQFEKGDLIMMYSTSARLKPASMQYSFDEMPTLVNSEEVQVQGVETKNVNLDNGRQVKVWDLEIHAEIEEGNVVKGILSVLDKDSEPVHAQYVNQLFQEGFSLPKGPARSQAMKEAWAEKERFASVDYSYVITSHKSQGSTYETVVVLENDIMSVGPTTNKSKSQSLYTAITRASNTAVIVSDRNTTSSTSIPETTPQSSALTDAGQIDQVKARIPQNLISGKEAEVNALEGEAVQPENVEETTQELEKGIPFRDVTPEEIVEINNELVKEKGNYTIIGEKLTTGYGAKAEIKDFDFTLTSYSTTRENKLIYTEYIPTINFWYKENDKKYRGAYSLADRRFTVQTSLEEIYKELVDKYYFAVKAKTAKITQGLEEQIQSLWLNYQSKLQAKHPGYTYERLKQVVAKHGIEKVTENLKKC